MIDRILSKKILEMSHHYPVVTLLGPRQSGKTTLVRTLFPAFAYADLEDPETRALARDDPKTFFENYPEPLLVDEVQRVPELLSHIQVRVDADRRRMGRFILTGSHQPRLKEAISQSLVGRTAELELLPLSLEELAERTGPVPTDTILLRGFFPDAWETDVPPTDFHRNYLRTYVERDVRTLLEVRNIAAFEKFLHLLAGRVGQIVNLDGLAGEVGVSAPTIENWISVAEASFVVFRLRPWFANVGKRFVKSPKIYFTDVGLAAYLLGIETPSQLARDPLRGSLFENMIIADLVKARTNLGREPALFFVRDSKGFEVDALYAIGRELRPFEIKSARTFDSSFYKNLVSFRSLVPECATPALVYDGESYSERGGVRCLAFRALSGRTVFSQGGKDSGGCR
ncbi:MAG: ATP-binding protein [Kiritimatiellae bacterium]|nr:ATP-binding protein [Kiritimatiellia bacterium]